MLTRTGGARHRGALDHVAQRKYLLLFAFKRMFDAFRGRRGRR